MTHAVISNIQPTIQVNPTSKSFRTYLFIHNISPEPGNKLQS